MNASLVLRARTVVANGEHEPLEGANEVARERSGERVDDLNGAVALTVVQIFGVEDAGT